MSVMYSTPKRKGRGTWRDSTIATRKPLSLSITDEVINKYRAMAKERGVSVSRLVEDVLEENLIRLSAGKVSKLSSVKS